jgi:DNA-binding NtrC family response regulator
VADHPTGTDVLTPSGAQAPPRLKLVVVSGPDFGREIVLEKGMYRVGKEEGNELVLKDTAISRTHLIVEVVATGVRVSDNGSTNGSFLNGSRFTAMDAPPGAVIQIGRTELKIVPATDRNATLPPSEKTSFGGLAGKSLRMREIFGLLERVARTTVDVLVHGETGTGKELCAEAIHAASDRSGGPFVVCDLASVAPTLIESELFGHVKGAFTGAQVDRAGAFERAHGGTLFLDEVGDLGLDIQPRLLRALERRQVKRVGANDYKTVDVRVLAASHKDLEAEVKTGRFREDLYHRLAVVKITLPPLRERPEDIPFLVDHFLARLGKEPGALAPETRALLADYAWPGNVRELRNVVERAVSLGGETALPPSAGLSVNTPGKGIPTGTADLPFKEAKDNLVAAFERDYLADLLRRCEGNISRAAREAGIDRVYLHRLIKKHNLEVK